MNMIALPAVIRSIGLHVLPGVVCVILASILLFLWELRRVSGHERARAGGGVWLPAAGLTLSVLACALIFIRFAVIH